MGRSAASVDRRQSASVRTFTERAAVVATSRDVATSVASNVMAPIVVRPAPARPPAVAANRPTAALSARAHGEVLHLRLEFQEEFTIFGVVLRGEQFVARE